MRDIQENDGGPITFTREDLEHERAIWGTPEQARTYLEETEPSRPMTRALIDRYARLIRRSQSPGAWTAVMEATMVTDASELLSAITAPTLVIGRPELTIDRRYDASKRLADLIPGARYVDAPGRDIPPWGEGSEALIGSVERFVSTTAGWQEVDRALTTVLISYVAGLSPQTERRGGTADDDLFAPFRELVRDQLAAHQGKEGRSPEGVWFATFEGPARAVNCALAIGAEAATLGLASQAGVHTGEVTLARGELHGRTVEIGAAVAGATAPSETLVTAIVRDLVAGSGLAFEEVERELDIGNGRPEPWRLFRVRTDDPSDRTAP
jgi:class 3 adenylate cyclase